jgi:hypothetical protein
MSNGRYTPERARRLAFIRHLLRHAKLQTETDEPLCALALLSLHDAAELQLVLAAEATNANVKASAQFLEYWAPIDDRLAPLELGHKVAMRAVSDARRGLKHSGVLPSAAEIRRFAASTEDFLFDSARAVFDVDLALVSLADFIVDDAARRQLRVGEDALQSGDAGAALASARLAFEHLMRGVPSSDPVKERTSRWFRQTSFPYASSTSLTLAKSVGSQFAREWDRLTKAVRRSEEVLLVIARGIDYLEFLRFEAITPHAYWTLGSAEPHLAAAATNGTLEDAQWALDFVVRYGLAAES